MVHILSTSAAMFAALGYWRVSGGSKGEPSRENGKRVLMISPCDDLEAKVNKCYIYRALIYVLKSFSCSHMMTALFEGCAQCTSNLEAIFFAFKYKYHIIDGCLFTIFVGTTFCFAPLVSSLPCFSLH